MADRIEIYSWNISTAKLVTDGGIQRQHALADFKNS